MNRRPCEGGGRWRGSARLTAAPAFAGATDLATSALNPKADMLIIVPA